MKKKQKLAWCRRRASILSSIDDILFAEVKMADDIQAKLEKYRTAPFDARFPNQNQTRNCWSNYLDYHRCQKALDAKGVDTAPCEWYKRVYKSLCPISWVNSLFKSQLFLFMRKPVLEESEASRLVTAEYA
ncbi:hypothetical protein L3Q82_010699 [Scortum barcoo]|uniref:Uncharacterized protein n=1 Tax=Scortum barcoo TaxID=214431 RepID=A0ACB8WCV5_9TELE|nr:hypothetical protein L3Q82_010699 [Scortum barcoo]